MTSDRDPAIGSLLDRIEAEPPGPTFWDDVQRRLESGDRVVELRPVARPATRRRALVAVAAAVVVGLVVFAVSKAGSDNDKVVPLTTTTTTPAGAIRALDAMDEWIRDVRAEDGAAAWALLGPQSRANFAGSEAFGPGGGGGYASTWGRGIDRDVRRTVAPLSRQVDDELWLVMLRSDPAPRGTGVYLTALVRVAPDGARVEPFLPGNNLGLVDSGLQMTPPDRDPVVHIDADAAHAVVVLDGTVVPESAYRRDASGAVVAVHPARPLTAGSHDLVVAYQTRLGDLLLASTYVHTQAPGGS